MNYDNLIEKLIDLAIEEDIATGDVTTGSIISSKVGAVATMKAKADGVISGIEIIKRVFLKFQQDIVWIPYVKDGDRVKKGDIVLRIEALYSTLLMGERISLNIFQRMCGIATATSVYVKALEGTKTELLDTRKTVPGMRVFDKMAVKHGGGTNHRMGLYDMSMIKDNHIKMAGSITKAVEQVRSAIPSTIKIEVETSNLEEVREAVAAKADIIMLDNMDNATMTEAVKIINGAAKTEASGNMNVERLKGVAETGVDFISVGALTHSVTAMDISMNIQTKEEELIDKINKLKKEKNAIILAHYYTNPAVQDIADFLGDSLELSKKAGATDADIILFCGVHFMAETASIISPNKKVLIPVLGAGCSLADGATGKQLHQWKSENPNGVIVSYVNTTADVKAETDYCCTSANAINVVKSLPTDANVLFVPDVNLGGYINKTSDRNMNLWTANCYVHHSYTTEKVLAMMEKHPQAEVLIHPEASCSCDEKILNNPKCFMYSSSGILRHAKESENKEFIIVTEPGILHKLQKESPEKIFIPLDEKAVCTSMKKITLENIYEALVEEKYSVQVDKKMAEEAMLPIKRMMSL